MRKAKSKQRFHVVQDERVVSDEEVKEWKRTEKEIREKQNSRWLRRERRIKEADHELPILLLLVLIIKAGSVVLRSVFQVKFSEFNLQLLSCWPVDFIILPLYLICLYGSGRFKIGIPEPVQPEVFENEDDDEWEDSMTTKELQSRQKALVNRWSTLEKKPVEHLKLNFWCSLVRFVNMTYFLVRVGVIAWPITENLSEFFLYSTKSEILFVLVEYISSAAVSTFCLVPIIDEILL
ncbi:hypothetical protein CAEBREN_10172 [Caenorhabditis brenneri]|uniref:Uncharacterized protein n=1 Tax=Caenorhabditis brenneri TaxID=135651 RepID=G0MBV8_CAEBE|nr:hypothetical protein CAEBREN_10172 [Caenorhabditis brenneri]